MCVCNLILYAYIYIFNFLILYKIYMFGDKSERVQD